MGELEQLGQAVKAYRELSAEGRAIFIREVGGVQLPQRLNGHAMLAVSRRRMSRGIRRYWATMSAEQRSQEMRRRYRVWKNQ